MLTSGSLTVVPESVVFSNCQSGNSYLKEIFIHNVGKRPIRIRYLMPYDQHFVLLGNSSVMIPPGLETKASIRYFCKSNDSQETQLKIQGPDGTIVLPISAHPPCASVSFDKKELNFGIIPPKASHKQKIRLSNAGTKSADYQIRCGTFSLTATPSTGTIIAGAFVDIEVELKPTKVGAFESTLAVMTNGSESAEPVKVTANVIEHEIVLIHEGEEVRELNFGAIYYGQKKIFQVTVKNKAAVKRSFTMVPPHDPNSPTSFLAMSRAPAVSEPGVIFTAVPCEGTLKPFGSTVISMVFSPPAGNPKAPQPEKMFNHLSSILIEETKQMMDFQISGNAVNIDYELSSVDFNFGRQLVGTKASQVLTVENVSPLLPITFEFKKIAHFHCKPESGTIKPGEKKDVEITFLPKNMGEFEVSTVMDICKGLSKRRINFVGVSVAKDVEPKKFKRTPLWESDASAKYNAEYPSNRYGMSNDELRRKSKLREEFDGYLTKSASARAKREEEKEKLANATKYAESFASHNSLNFSEKDIQEFVKKRLAMNDPTNGDALDLGMEHYEGMKPPPPVLPRGPNRLVVPEPEKLGLVSSTPRSARGSSLMQQNRKPVAKKFKASPTTPPEMVECAKKLSPTDLTCIVASHQSLNFGQVSVYSTEKRSFEITNELQQHILVKMNYSDDELKRSTPQSQVIPPMQTAGFDIIMSAKEPRNFVRQIHYTINNQHKFAVNIGAQIVGIDVSLSRSSVEFSFPPKVSLPYAKEDVRIVNNSKSVVQYTWGRLNQFFSIKPESGRIDPQSFAVAEITYTPGTVSKSEMTAVLNVIGGKSCHLKLIGNMGKPKLLLNHKRVVFGMIPTEEKKDMIVSMKNVGDSPAIFTLQPNHGCVSVSPTSGRVEPGSTSDLCVSVYCASPGDISTFVPINICGCEPIKMEVCATPQLPRVQLLYDNLDFGDVFVGGSDSRSLSFKNDGSTPAVMFMNLTDHPFFHLEIPAEYGLIAEDDCSSSVFIVTDMGSSHEQSAQGLSECSTASFYGNGSITMDANVGFIYKIIVIPGDTVNVSLVFQPMRIGRYDFNVPVSLLHVTGFAANAMVKAEAVHSPVLPSESSLDFGITPIYNTENPASAPAGRQIVLRNESRTPVNFRFDNQSANFIVSPKCGRIDYSSSVNLTLNFRPFEPIPYSYLLPLYATTDKGEILVSRMQLIGVGTERRFQTSTNYVCLPAVPLGMRSERTIDIINVGSVQTKLSVKFAVNEKNFPIEVTFPKGDKLTVTTPRIPLNIAFVCDRPMSFSTVVALIDSSGGQYSFTVSVTTDNSIFTLYPFFSMNKCRISGGTSGPFTGELCGGRVEPDIISEVLSSPDLVLLNNLTPRADKPLVSFLVKYLNSLVLTNPIRNFPGDLIDTNGMILIEMIENLTGHKIQTSQIFKQQSPGSRAQSSMLAMNTPKREKMRLILQYLMSQGAHVSSIKPEFLLSEVDFIDYYRHKTTRLMLGLDYYGAKDASEFDSELMSEYTSNHMFSSSMIPRLRVAERLYEHVSRESWIIVILQILKLFVESKIHWETMLQQPGVQNALDSLRDASTGALPLGVSTTAKAIACSNVFNSVESTLLKWISIHHCKIGNSVVLDFDELRNPGVFLSLFKSHMSKAKLTSNKEVMEMSPTEQIIAYMKETRMNLDPCGVEITQGNRCCLALMAMQMYLTLPHFCPTASIEFNTKLCHSQVQTVTISNPSKREITYHATLDGPSDFKLTDTAVTLKPGQSSDFRVEYFARRYASASATLTLIPEKLKSEAPEEERIPQTSRRPRSSVLSARAPEKRAESSRQATEAPTTATTIVMDLNAETVIKEPYETITVESSIFTPKKFKISVQNATNECGLFKVYHRYFQIEDENGKRIGPKITTEERIRAFLEDPQAEPEYPTATTPFVGLVQQHHAFLIDQKELEFQDPQRNSTLECEFVPISLGKYQCLILISNADLGEYVYEIEATAVVPPPVISKMPIKVEVNQKQQIKLDLDIVNPKLCECLSYSITRIQAQTSYVSERKFHDLLNFHTREITTKFLQVFISTTFTVSCSSEFFTANETFTNRKTSGTAGESLPVTFCPTKPGDYPCKVALTSDYDVRCFQITGTGLAPSKSLEIDLKAVMGRQLKQELPFNNPSNSVWNFKTDLRGDSHFTVPSRFSVQANSCLQVPLTFMANQVGDYHATLTVTNTVKEITVKYLIVAHVEDPPAESKIVLQCKAKKEYSKVFDLPTIINNGVIQVQSTVPILDVPETIEFENGYIKKPFVMRVYSMVSGVTAGRLQFIDISSGTYIWYIIEVHVDHPEPEEIIDISSVARQSVTVKIPVHNPHDAPVTFQVGFKDEDFFGPKDLVIRAKSTSIYELVFSPLSIFERTSYVSFINDDKGEFVYQINCVSLPPTANTCAPLTSPIGKYASTQILLENPVDKRVFFRVTNANNDCFQIMSKPNIQLGPKEKKSIEVRYLPTSVGVQQTTTITLTSREVGEWNYKFVGIGKPPQPQSPIILECSPDDSASGSILFSNPFGVMSKFEVSVSSEQQNTCFEILSKRRIFTLGAYGDTQQVSFAFRPTKETQFSGSIVISTLDKESGIRWTYPLICRTLASGKREIPRLIGRAGEIIELTANLPLVAETETFSKESYVLETKYPHAYDWLVKIMKVEVLGLETVGDVPNIVVFVRLQPRRPIEKSFVISITNPFGQTWDFPIMINVERGDPMETIELEGRLKEHVVTNISVNEVFTARTAFHAYFANGSASEMSVSPSQGYIEAALDEVRTFPFDIHFTPTIYGKVMKGLLVVDTLEAQYLYDVVGKIPEYAPPSGLTATFSTKSARSETQNSARRRNIIRDNIKNAGLPKSRKQ